MGAIEKFPQLDNIVSPWIFEVVWDVETFLHFFYPYMEAFLVSCKDSCIVQKYDNFNRLFEDGNTVITIIVRAVNLGILTRLSNYIISTKLWTRMRKTEH